MKRDLDLIRGLLLKLEDVPVAHGESWVLSSEDKEVAIEGYDDAKINHHLSLIADAGFIRTNGSRPMLGIIFQGLTWNGCEYLDNIRDPEIWAKTKEGAQKVGGFSLEIVGALAKGLIKKQVEKHTGVEIEI